MHCAARREPTPHGRGQMAGTSEASGQTESGASGQIERAALPGKWQGQITHEDRRSLALAELYVPPKLLRSRPRHIASVVLEDQGVAARRDHEELADHRRRQGPWLRHSLAPEWNPLRPPPAASLAESQRTLSAPAAAARSRSQNSAVRGRDELRGPMARRGQWLGGRIWEEAHPSRRRARPPRHPQATTPRLALWSVSALGSGLHIFVGKGCSPSSLSSHANSPASEMAF